MVSALPLLVALAAGSADAYVLTVDEGAWDVAVVDVNGDGRSDVVALCCDENSFPLVKSLAVFLADESGGYADRASTVLRLDPRVGVVFFAEMDGEGPKEVVAAHQLGAIHYRFVSGSYERSGESRFVSLLPTGSKEPMFLKDAAPDLDGDGIDEWLIPVASGYEVRNGEGLVCAIPCDVVSEVRSYGSLVVSNRLPAYHLFELPGSEQKGLAFLSDRFADFAYGENWSKHERYRIPENLDGKWEATTTMKDIDGNGFPDLVVSQTQGTINLKVQTSIYMASAPFEYPATPTATFETVGAITTPVLRDVDGDGKQDLIFISVPFSIKTLINYFLRGKLSLKGEVHLFDGEGFPETPSFRARMTLDAPEGRELVVFALGDFTGDGRLDVAYGSDKGKLSVFEGTKRDFVSSRPWMTFDVPTFGVARPHDLNGNGREDIIIHHPGGEHRKRIEAIIF